MQINSRPGFWSYFWISFFTIWVGLFAVFFGAAARQFTELFKGFGADLPSFTAFVMGNLLVIWPLLLLLFLVQLGLGIYFFISRTHSARLIVLIALWVNVAIQIALVFALYTPIFKLGSVV